MNEDEKKEQYTESFLGNSEVAVDIFTDNDLLASIPVVSIAASLLKARDSIRDGIIKNKLSSFLFELDKLDDYKILEFKEKLQNSPEESKEIGSLLIELIDKVIGIDKPKLIAILFIAYLDRVIDVVEFKRIAQAVPDVAFWDDLVMLLHVNNTSGLEKEKWMGYLVSAGLTNFRSGGLIGDNGEPRYFISELGNKLTNAYRQARRYQKSN